MLKLIQKIINKENNIIKKDGNKYVNKNIDTKQVTWAGKKK